MTRAVFLDRDGVITRSLIRDGRPYAPRSLDEFEILPGVAGALTRLRDAGFLLIVVTNQPDVRKGLVARADVEAMHRRLREALPLDDLFVCYHDDRDGCACRKPSPGMLYAAAVAHEVTLGASCLVGDRWRDIEAGRRAGCTTILVDGGHHEAVASEPHARQPDLDGAASWILAAGR
ncbi:MAG: HAD family hydrolase [Acidobacteria bacterium]|nr:HAD family hydrolase [Acidobacteriota bacterium]